MRIRELHLHGFGKFNEYTLKLEPGLNIIYGPNESGKSTLHSFINGMFYGFKKPYAKRTLYSNDHTRLSPWSGSIYSGSIVFEKDGQSYRIFRVFDKGKEETRVFHEETGEDITDRIHNGENSKVLQPGEYFFGINSGIFNNTLFIGQQKIAPGKSLAHEVRERLINVSTGGDENISVEKAIFLLDEELKEIGTSRASTSEYGKLISEIQETEKRLRALEAEAVKYREHVTKRKAITDELKSVESDIENSKAHLEEKEKLEKIHKYQEILGLRHTNNQLGEEIEGLAIHETKCQEDYNEAVKLSEEIGLVHSRIDSMEEQLKDIEDRGTRLYGARDREDKISKDIIEDGYRFQKLDYQTTEDKNLPYLENEKEKFAKSRRALTLSLTIFSMVYLSSITVASVQGNYSILAAAQIFLIPILYSIKEIRELKNRIESRQDLMDIEMEKDILLKKHNLLDKYDLYKLFERARAEETRSEQEREALAELHVSRETISAKINDLNADLLAMQRQLDGILSKNLAIDMESFYEGLNKKSRLREIKREIEYNQETIKRILKDENLEKLRLLYEEKSSGGNDIPSKSMVETVQSHEKLLQKKADILLKIKQVEGSLSQLEDSMEQEIGLNENLDALKKREAKFRSRRRSLEMAKERIKDLSSDIHREFAPSLNKRVGEFIGSVTAGLYSEVKVDKNLNFNLVNSESNRLVPLENLSGGALDQMYFGLRLGIVDELISSSLPICLDECFSQYDDLRLRRILNFITNLEDRQIILFTCQLREEEVLKSTDKKYNKIDLQYS